MSESLREWRMFGRLKNLFRRRAGEETYADAESSAYPPREFHAGYTPGQTGAGTALETQAPPADAGAGTAAAEAADAAGGDSVRILLKPVLLKLPDPLKARVRQPPAGPYQISIPLDRVLEQLPQGSVKISFGELRQASPAGVFAEMSDQDQAAIDLPLQDILAQLRPDQLPRRSQKRVEVPDDVAGIFGSKGQPLTNVRMGSPSARPAAPPPGAGSQPSPDSAPEPSPAPVPLKAAAPAPPPAAVPRPALRPSEPTAPAVPGRPAATPIAAPQTPAPIKPISPLPPPGARPSGPLPSTPIKPTTPLPSLTALRPAPTAPLPAAGPAAAPAAPVIPAQIPAAPAPAPVSEPVSPRPSAPLPPAEPLVVSLAQVSGAWPPAIRQTLPAAPDATVTLPGEELEQALKRGRIVFPWRRLSAWVHPRPSLPEDQVPDETPLELPLAVLAPLFMAHKRPAAQQRRSALPEDIPDIFAARGMPSAIPLTAPAVPMTAPAAVQAPAAVPAVPAPAAPAVPVRPAAAAPAPASAPAPPREIGDVFGQPGRKNWAPSEIVQRTSALRGVAGALIAMQDGLLVAEHLPQGLHGETIAAFLPQMFTRMLQYTKELKFGEADNLTIIVENVPLKTFKVGGVYFAVLGRDGEPLPEPHLSIVAAQLGPQTK